MNSLNSELMGALEKGIKDALHAEALKFVETMKLEMHKKMEQAAYEVAINVFSRLSIMDMGRKLHISIDSKRPSS